jgi:hypothetical protein
MQSLIDRFLELNEFPPFLNAVAAIELAAAQ